MMPKFILLADDSVTIQKVVELTFSEGDYQVTCVSNGKLALQKIQEQRPDILLCDVIMPELNGYEVCSAVKHTPELAGIPVILMTGTFEPFDEDKARQAGADTFVTKPFESKMLVEKVEELLRKRMVLDTTVPVESVQIFSSREEFTLESPPPSDEAFLASEAAKIAPVEKFESPFLAPETVAPTPVSDTPQALPPPPMPEVPTPSFPAPESAPPPSGAVSSVELAPEGAFEEVFAPPPAISPEEFTTAPPPVWESAAPAQTAATPVPPSPAEALFEEEAPAVPAAFEEVLPAAPLAEPELPPFDTTAPAEPLEVVHDMMDQQQMVAQAQTEVPEVEIPTPSPFEETYEQPPLEMPYESLAPPPSHEAPSLEFPDAPDPIEAAPILESFVFEGPASMASIPEPLSAPPPAEVPGEFLPESPSVPVAETASAAEVLPTFDHEPAIVPTEAPPPVLGFIETASQASPEPLPPAGAFEGVPALAPVDEAPLEGRAEPFGVLVAEPSPVPGIPPWEPPVTMEVPAVPVEEVVPPLPAEEILDEMAEEIPTVPAEEELFSFTPPEEVPHAEIAAPTTPVEPPLWEPPDAEEPPLTPSVEDVAEAQVAMPVEVDTFAHETAQEPLAVPAEVHYEPAFVGEAPLEMAVPPFINPISAEESPFPAQSSADTAVMETEPVSTPDREPPPQEVTPAEPAAVATAPSFSSDDLEAAIRKVVAEMAPDIIRQVAWEVIPELAESLIKRRISELESDGD
jgi:CheY-like chemotaxis protein